MEKLVNLTDYQKQIETFYTAIEYKIEDQKRKEKECRNYMIKMKKEFASLAESVDVENKDVVNISENWFFSSFDNYRKYYFENQAEFHKLQNEIHLLVGLAKKMFSAIAELPFTACIERLEKEYAPIEEIKQHNRQIEKENKEEIKKTKYAELTETIKEKNKAYKEITEQRETLREKLAGLDFEGKAEAEKDIIRQSYQTQNRNLWQVENMLEKEIKELKQDRKQL